MEITIEKGGRRLRCGYTTGSCAAAAAKAAAFMLLSGRRIERIFLQTPKRVRLTLPVREIEIKEDTVCCAIEKDSGDDPDITNGLYIHAAVSRTKAPGIIIEGGAGIGRVTKRGLDQPVGAAAINSVPRRMIRENLEEICRLLDYRGGLQVLIFAPQGITLAEKTFNPRLGIKGGLSILGTTGIVEPMSEKALTDTIATELRQRRALGESYALLTPGNYGLDFIRGGLVIDPDRAVMVSNFVGDALDCCREQGFSGALLVGHIGKLVKLAGGMFNTHSQYGDCRMDILTAEAAACGLPSARAAEMLACAACDDALRILTEEGLVKQTMQRLTARIDRLLALRAGERMQAGALLFSKSYGALGKTAHAAALLQKIKEG